MRGNGFSNFEVINFLICHRLLNKVQSEDPAWKDSGIVFITSVTRLLERLLDYRSVIQGDENRDKRMSCTVNLLVTIFFLPTIIKIQLFQEFFPILFIYL